MHIATWLVVVPWRNSFIGAFSEEFQNLRSDANLENEPAPSARQQDGRRGDLTVGWLP